MSDDECKCSNDFKCTIFLIFFAPCVSICVVCSTDSLKMEFLVPLGVLKFPAKYFPPATHCLPGSF